MTLRLAAALVLLFGFTPTTIARIRIGDVTRTEGRVYLKIGRCPLILPGSLGDLLVEVATHVPAPGHASIVTPDGAQPWLFPGVVPGHHTDPGKLALHLSNQFGVPIRDARNSALTTLALDLPAPVLADLLGVGIETAIRWSHLVTHDWGDYLAHRTTEPAAAPAEDA